MVENRSMYKVQRTCKDKYKTQNIRSVVLWSITCKRVVMSNCLQKVPVAL